MWCVVDKWCGNKDEYYSEGERNNFCVILIEEKKRAKEITMFISKTVKTACVCVCVLEVEKERERERERESVA